MKSINTKLRDFKRNMSSYVKTPLGNVNVLPAGCNSTMQTSYMETRVHRDKSVFGKMVIKHNCKIYCQDSDVTMLMDILKYKLNLKAPTSTFYPFTLTFVTEIL